MDILAIDAMIDPQGRPWIIELNGTACGFPANVWLEHSQVLADMVLDRMSALFAPAAEPADADEAAAAGQEQG